VQHLPEFFASGKFLQAAPVFGAGSLLNFRLHGGKIKLLALARANIDSGRF
jgi:hypothetical protein